MNIASRFDGKRYHNAVPTSMSTATSYWQMARRWLLGREERVPRSPLPAFTVDAAALARPVPAAALRATWLGHSTVLLEIDGRRFLTDPVWRARSSPVGWAGPERFFPNPLPLAQVPPLDGVLLSHDHYDHLDPLAVRALARTGVPFFCPLGVGRHLRRWGVAADQITELDWWQALALAPDFTLVATPARHFSGRRLGLDQDATLWASWALLGPTHRAFFGGDSGPFDAAFQQIGAAYGPFDLTMLEIGAADPDWANVHLGPAGAVAAHQLLGGRALLPLHWGTFNLAYHAWNAPAEEVEAVAAAAGVPLLLPRPGERVAATQAPYLSGWWRL
ncbi:MBL fold metallo-hydrolase [Hymenobacter sp. BT175]|uniref:MBL fold metallo-hydrolase n=1 Tax=Hymenobacter translucens TaxID=2886507 RepID=UPI001D0EE419|nr:MBL fold metallo-hydrolase [Hymenobacter translucens]MCC2548591.1 MBL fold metallo-hydrolase [Hymenobacter translucens]